jgi:hypothetical protein
VERFSGGWPRLLARYYHVGMVVDDQYEMFHYISVDLVPNLFRKTQER